MKPPYLICMACQYPLRQLAFPVSLKMEVDKCPKCGEWKHIDVVIGTSWDQMRADYPEDTVLFVTPDKPKKE